MTEQHESLDFRPSEDYVQAYHVQPGTTVDFASRVVAGTCYSLASGQELLCRRCGSTETKRISASGGAIRDNAGALVVDTAVSKCLKCGWGYIWRIVGD